MGATATVEIDTETDKDAQTIYEKSLNINKVCSKKLVFLTIWTLIQSFKCYQKWLLILMFSCPIYRIYIIINFK